MTTGNDDDKNSVKMRIKEVSGVPHNKEDETEKDERIMAQKFRVILYQSYFISLFVILNNFKEFRFVPRARTIRHG